MSFALCLPIILEAEGGYVDNPDDPGGPTNLGVTQATLSDWLGRDATVDEVKALTPETVAPIYEENYYNLAHCPDLPAGVDLMAFNAAVNSGPGRAIKLLQKAVGVIADAHFGPNTLAAVKASRPVQVIADYRTAYETFYRSLSTFDEFGRGWLSRLDEVRDDALGMVGT